MEQIREFVSFLADGAVVTLEVTLATVPLMILIAFIVGLIRLSRNRLLYGIATIYVELIRGTPLLLQLFYIFYVLPFAGFEIEPFSAAVLALGLNFGGYLSEVVRASFQSVARGQWEAAVALNMSPALTMRRIIFPQAIRILLPPLGNNIIELFKATAIVSLVSVHDLTYQGTVLTTRTFQTAVIWVLVSGFYFLMSYPSTFVVRWLERRTAFP